ncbi:SET domain-containing protein-lysine N-methyltransferase [Babesia caballi]|uniref:SET domain-containing protein-lysine N-methyltransferase n=1 Tax=Babesia caballi TaxID=5871 RepID=A0AAV4LWF4_BABCB|nr:SET domain-containing protein-lysine N-methyltransferase [Babesia caballi]
MYVTTSAARLRRGVKPPHRDEHAVEPPLVPLHDELVRARDGLDLVLVAKLPHDVAAEEESGAARTRAPAVHGLGVAPHEVAHGALVRHLLLAVEVPDLVDGGDGRREPAVDAKVPVVDQRADGEVVEDLGAVAPHVDAAILPHALVVEAVHLRDVARLVVPADEGDAIGVPDLEAEQQEEGLDGVVAAVHEVAEEQIVGLRYVLADREELLEVVELPVNVSADLRQLLGRCRSGIRRICGVKASMSG